MEKFNALWEAALASNSKLEFVAERANGCVGASDDERYLYADQCGRIWELAHMSVADIRHATGLSQGAFAEMFCIPRRTVIGWEQRGGCTDYVRLMMARLCGLTEGLLDDKKPSLIPSFLS